MADHWEVKSITLMDTDGLGVDGCVNLYLYENPGYRPISVIKTDCFPTLVELKLTRRVVN